MSAPSRDDRAPLTPLEPRASDPTVIRELPRDPALAALLQREHAARSAEATEVLAADLATRLRRVCAHLPEAEFAALVDGIARTKMRWSATYGSVLSTPPVGDLVQRRPPRRDRP